MVGWQSKWLAPSVEGKIGLWNWTVIPIIFKELLMAVIFRLRSYGNLFNHSQRDYFRILFCFWIFEFYFIYFFTQQVLISHPFYTHQCIHVNPNRPIQHTTTTTPRHFHPLVSIRLFSTSVSLSLPCKPVHLYHFSRFHIYALIYNICFSLSDVLHSVWQSLEVHLHLYKWPNLVSFYGRVIFHCIYVPQLLYPFDCRWAFRLLPWPGYWKQCCNEHWGALCPFKLWFSLGICPVVVLLGHMVILFLVF